MTLFLLIVALHLAADFVLPTSFLAWGGGRGKGLMHAVLFGLTSAVALLLVSREWFVWAPVLALAHWGIDWAGTRMETKLGKAGIGWFLFDQCLHIGSIGAVMYFGRLWVDGPTLAYLGTAPRLLIYLDGLVWAALAGAIVTWLVGGGRLSTLSDREAKEALGLQGRWPGMLERGVVALVTAWGHPWLAVAVYGPIVWVKRREIGHDELKLWALFASMVVALTSGLVMWYLLKAAA